MRQLLPLLLLFATACPPNAVTPGPDADAQVPPPPDAAPPSSDGAQGDVCAAACARLVALNCPEGTPPPGGRPCVDTCHVAGGVYDLHPGCVAAAGSLIEVRQCGVACEPAPAAPAPSSRPGAKPKRP